MILLRLIRIQDSVRLEKDASRLTSVPSEKSFSSSTGSGGKSAKRKISIATSQEKTSVPDLQRKISVVSFKGVPEDNHNVMMRSVSQADVQSRMTTGLSTSLSTDDDTVSCQDFNEAEMDEIRKMNIEVLTKSKRQLTKTEKKLRKEQAMQRK